MDLLIAITAGDRSAIDILYSRHASTALGLAVRIVRDRQVAEDVVRDAFVAFWRRAALYDGQRGAPREWLLGLVRERAIDHLRGPSALARREPIERALAHAEAGNGEFGHGLWSRITPAEIASAVDTLPSEQREVIALAIFEGLTRAEIADRVRLPLDTIAGHMRLGMRKLRSIVRGRDLDPDG